MARTIDEIQQEIIDAIQNDAALSQATSTSVSALWRLWARVVAMAIATLENLWDLFKTDVNAEITILKPHTARWYQNKALGYLHGFDLVEGDDSYNTEGIDKAVIDAAKVVKAAATVETNGSLVVKVSAEFNGDLIPLSVAQYDGFSAYMAEIKDAGVPLQILSFSADKMTITIDLYYDPLILAGDGSRLDGSASEPVRTAIESFLKNLPFDGQFVKAHLVDSLQQIEGVFVPEIKSCKATRFDSATFEDVEIKYNPYSGFIRIYNDVDCVINYIPNV